MVMPKSATRAWPSCSRMFWFDVAVADTVTAGVVECRATSTRYAPRRRKLLLPVELIRRLPSTKGIT
jgi:hypothetical protein